MWPFDRINLDDWIEVGKEPEGFQNKYWLRNPVTGQTGLFKYGLNSSNQCKHSNNGFDEKFTCEAAKLSGILCADGDMAVHRDKTGFISFNFVQENQILKHGHDLLCDHYHVDHEQNLYTKYGAANSVFEMQQILGSLFQQMVPILVFDCLVGNADRHDKNWGILIDSVSLKKLWVAPMYDTELPIDFDTGLLVDTLDFDLLPSVVALDYLEPTHFEILKYLSKYFYAHTYHVLLKMHYNITSKSLNSLLKKFERQEISDKLKEQLSDFITDRLNKMKTIVFQGRYS